MPGIFSDDVGMNAFSCGAIDDLRQWLNPNAAEAQAHPPTRAVRGITAAGTGSRVAWDVACSGPVSDSSGPHWELE